MTGPWIRPSKCSDNACPQWRWHPDGSLELGTTDSDDTTTMNRRDALSFIDAVRRGEVRAPSLPEVVMGDA